MKKGTKKTRNDPPIAPQYLAPNSNNDPLLDRIAAGANLRILATELGITPQSLWQRLRNDPAYYAALEVRHATKLDDAEQAIEDSSDRTDVARARVKWSATAWRAERECPGTWGQQQATVAVQVNVNPNQSYNQMADGQRLEFAQRVALILSGAEAAKTEEKPIESVPVKLPAGK